MNFDLFIFDLDGTLIDSSTDLVNAVQAMLAKYGLQSKDAQEIKTYIGQGLAYLLKCSLDGDEKLFTKIYPDFLHYYGAHLTDNTNLYPHVREVLAKLADKKLAVLTNKNQEFTDKILQYLGIASAFSIILGGDKVSRKKPFPDGIESILAATHTSKDKAMIIGDSEHDIKAGVAAGIATCFVTYGIGEPNGLSPTYTLSNLIELCTIPL